MLPSTLCWLAFTAAWSASAGNSDVCSTVVAKDVLAESHRTDNDYFDNYFVRKEKGVYRVRAIKSLKADPDRADDVMSA